MLGAFFSDFEAHPAIASMAMLIDFIFILCCFEFLNF